MDVVWYCQRTQKKSQETVVWLSNLSPLQCTGITYNCDIKWAENIFISKDGSLRLWLNVVPKWYYDLLHPSVTISMKRNCYYFLSDKFCRKRRFLSISCVLFACRRSALKVFTVFHVVTHFVQNVGRHISSIKYNTDIQQVILFSC